MSSPCTFIWYDRQSLLSNQLAGKLHCAQEFGYPKLVTCAVRVISKFQSYNNIYIIICRSHLYMQCIDTYLALIVLQSLFQIICCRRGRWGVLNPTPLTRFPWNCNQHGDERQAFSVSYEINEGIFAQCPLFKYKNKARGNICR